MAKDLENTVKLLWLWGSKVCRKAWCYREEGELPGQDSYKYRYQLIKRHAERYWLNDNGKVDNKAPAACELITAIIRKHAPAQILEFRLTKHTNHIDVRRKKNVLSMLNNECVKKCNIWPFSPQHLTNILSGCIDQRCKSLHLWPFLLACWFCVYVFHCLPWM